MKLYITKNDRFIYGNISFYFVAHIVSFALSKKYVELYYPEASNFNNLIWMIGLVLARLYKILIKRVYGGFSCLFPIIFLPFIVVNIYYYYGIIELDEQARLLDIVSMAIPIYMIFIRTANVRNSEIVGLPTKSTTCIAYEIHRDARMPVQLYEALAGFGLLLYHLLNPPCMGLFFNGQNWYVSIIAVLTCRIIIESYKDNQANYSKRYFYFNHEQWTIILGSILLTVGSTMGFIITF